MTRLPFLDWMRGLAVVIMIQCHVFNSYTRLELRQNGLYVWTQFIGGMAAPLFLFMAGMTSGFQMDRLDRSSKRRSERWFTALKRAGYIVSIAYLFRFTSWVGSLPNPNMQDFLKVDILNCMGLAMLVFSVAAVFDWRWRIACATAAAFIVAAASPLMSAVDWSGLPLVARYYLVPGPDHTQFAFFPCAAYLGFGIAAGNIVKRAASADDQSKLSRLMCWLAPAGVALTFGVRYLANRPFSIYRHADFWRTSPALILIRLGIILLLLTGAYFWTTLRKAARWSWMETLGKTSLLVYWVHVMLVYGAVSATIKRSLTPRGSAAATIVVILMMLALAHTRLRLKGKSLGLAGRFYPAAQCFRHAPRLGDATARSVGRLGIEDLAKGADARFVEFRDKSFQ